MSKFQIKSPTTVEFTLTTTMSLKDWVALKEQLRGADYNYPAYGLIQEIDDMVSQAEKVFYPKPEEV